jgi:hypothetical protein
MLRVMLAALVAAGATFPLTAAPVPKAPPPPAPKAGATFTLSVAKSAGGGLLELSTTAAVSKAITVNTNEVVNGQQVQVTRTQYVTENVPVARRITLTGTKATTADGKELDEDALAKRLGDGGAVVQVPAGFDPEWRKLFTDDVVFLETKAAAGVAPPMMAAPARLIRPALIPPPALPPPPPVEKREDKKEEKN